jgi:precorrin-6B methylase 2
VKALRADAVKAAGELEPPDRVFIGGSGGAIGPLLEIVKKRLRPGGRVVQTLVTMDSLEQTLAFWRDQPFAVEISQLQVNRFVPIGKTQRIEALNPVFVVVAWPASKS